MISLRSILLALLALNVGLPLSNAFAAESEVRIGFVVPLTGPEAEQGQQQMNVLQLGIKQAEKNGTLKGKTIKVIAEDNKSTNEGSVAAIQKLTQDPKVIAIFGTLKTPQVKAMLPTIRKSGVPTFIGATNSTLTVEGRPWIYRARPTDVNEQEAIIKFLKNMNITKVALLHNTDAYGTGAANFFMKMAGPGGINVVKRTPTGDAHPDLKPIYDDFEKAGAQAVVSYSNNVNQVESFIKQNHSLKKPFQYIGGPTHIQTSVMQTVKDDAEGIYVVSTAGWGVSDTSKKFQDAFRTAYHSEVDINNAWPYDLVGAVAIAVGSGAEDKEKLGAAIRKIKDYDGAIGKVSFDDSGEGVRDAKVIKIEKNGKFKLED
jgi:branched-chain amino acid transport system substrate-binding protein